MPVKSLPKSVSLSSGPQGRLHGVGASNTRASRLSPSGPFLPGSPTQPGVSLLSLNQQKPQAHCPSPSSGQFLLLTTLPRGCPAQHPPIALSSHSGRTETTRQLSELEPCSTTLKMDKLFNAAVT